VELRLVPGRDEVVLAIAVVETEVVLRIEQVGRADVQVAAAIPAARLEFDDHQPPSMIIEPDARAAFLDEAGGPEDRAGRGGDDLGVVHGRPSRGAAEASYFRSSIGVYLVSAGPV
jgi:hypothetical protein